MILFTSIIIVQRKNFTQQSKNLRMYNIIMYDRILIITTKRLIGITQSMSKAGYPYDNAPMERYFNTLKNDLIYQHYYRTEEELYTAIE